MKLTTPALMMCRVIAHHLFHNTEVAYESDGECPAFVKPSVLHEMFPIDSVRGQMIGKLEGMRDDHDGNFEQMVIRSGAPLWTTSHEIWDERGENTGRIETTGLRLTEAGLKALEDAGLIPPDYVDALWSNPAIFGTEAEFQHWLANEWKDPTTEGYHWYGKATSETGRKATIKGVSYYVDRLRYTPAEADAAKAVIDGDNSLTNRTRGAYKAHVKRRTVGA